MLRIYCGYWLSRDYQLTLVVFLWRFDQFRGCFTQVQRTPLIEAQCWPTVICALACALIWLCRLLVQSWGCALADVLNWVAFHVLNHPLHTAPLHSIQVSQLFLRQCGVCAQTAATMGAILTEHFVKVKLLLQAAYLAVTRDLVNIWAIRGHRPLK